MYSRLLVLLTGLLVQSGCASAEEDAPQHVGRALCATCHADQVAHWTGSHHDLAMQPANSKTVLGDFGMARVTQFGVTSTFSRKDGTYWVNTEGPDGVLQDYPIKYTFGVDPLQQYLIEFPGGRLQALGLAWDARPDHQGGQRWFHLYPDEEVAHDDELHWTQPSQNWNSMCAECHSTRLQKNYDPDTRIFATTWSEIDVSCEACHGPGSRHVAWAEREPGWEDLATGKGLVVALAERTDVRWDMDPHTGTASRSRTRGGDVEIETCARCHARRSPISRDHVHGESLLDHYLPRLLDADMYFADGQIDDEAYVYGSFVQSRMYHAGVTCSDCHEPHSLALRAPGNGVCLQCHQAERFDSPKHHFHAPESPGASCAECHMPPRTYMVVDPRHDHSMRIPRPDLSVDLRTPNACNQCHEDESPEWSVEQLETWYGRPPAGFQTYARALHAARNEAPAAGDALAGVIRDPKAPAIARATAAAEMGPYLSAETVDVLTRGLSDEDARVRAATLGLLDHTPAEMQVRLAFPMLEDPVRAVRMEAARRLAAFPTGRLSPEQMASLQRGMAEFIEAQLAMAERPEAQSNLGNLHAARGEFIQAVSSYQAAIELNPAYVPGYVNLADLHRAQGDEAQAERTLRRGVAHVPGSADLHHVLGLSLVRQQRTEEGIRELRHAAKLEPQSARFVYVYAVALHSAGNPDQAIMVLQGAHTAHPHDREVLGALVAFHRDSGDQAAARHYAEKLHALSP